MKILIGGGGTGGHVYPALALARYAQSDNSANDILFVGTEKGLESKIVPSAGFSLKTIPVRSFQGNLRQLVSTLFSLLDSLKQTSAIIKEYRPNVILGMGGYVAAPVVISGLIKRFPVVLHEQNAHPGLVNRRLAPFVKRVCLSFAETEKRMPRYSRILYTGNPRATEVSTLTRTAGCRHFNLDPEDKNILIYGGSRGALKLNQEVTAYLEAGFLPEDVNLIYVTGEIYYREVVSKLGTIPNRVKLYPYLDRMPEALAAADLAVTRSGATTLAELTALGIPALLIPSPNVVNNHQYYNAKLLADAGAAILIEEKDFDFNRLKKEVDLLLNEQSLLKKMKSNSIQIGEKDAAKRLYRCLQEVSV